MFERFTTNARRVLTLAKETAQSWNHEWIGTEHILCGLLRIPDSTAMLKLRQFGFDPDAIRSEVEKRTKPGAASSNLRNVPFTPRAKKVLEFALEAAGDLNSATVHTIHLLFGLVRETEGIAGAVLASLGLTEDALRGAVRSSAAKGEQPAQPPPEPASNEPEEKSRTPALDALGVDLTEEIARIGSTRCVGRDSEIDDALAVLCRRQRSNPILVGEPGVGKTQLLLGLAENLKTSRAAPSLNISRVVAFDVVRIFSGAQYRGQLEERVSAMFFEVRRVEGILLVIENLAEWLGAGRMTIPSALDAAFVLRSAIDRTRAKCVATATPSELREIQAKDPCLATRFQPILLESTGRDATLAILREHRLALETHHRVRVHESALAEAYSSSIAHFPSRALPGVALDLLDFASSLISNRRSGNRADREPAHSIDGAAMELSRDAEFQVDSAAIREAARRMRLPGK